MDIKELIKAVGLDGEDSKEKADIITKEFNERLKEFNTISKKAKELEESQAKLNEELTSAKGISDKFDIVVKAYGLDLEAEDFDKMLDDTKDKLIKDNGGGTTPEEVKTITRDLTKTRRDLEKANEQIKEVTAQLETERNMRIDALKRDAIQKALISNNVIKPEQMVDLFFNKVSLDKDGVTLLMKDSAGNELTLADGITDWAKENKEFVKAETHGGFGSSGGSNGSNSNEMSEFMKNLIANKQAASGATNNKTLGELFG